jgi:hypothetical protein
LGWYCRRALEAKPRDFARQSSERRNSQVMLLVSRAELAPKARAAASTDVPSVSTRRARGNARLTRELSEALERQAATSEVLEIISGRPGDLQAVFIAALKNAVGLCDANFGMLWLCEGQGRLPLRCASQRAD